MLRIKFKLKLNINQVLSGRLSFYIVISFEFEEGVEEEFRGEWLMCLCKFLFLFMYTEKNTAHSMQKLKLTQLVASDRTQNDANAEKGGMVCDSFVSRSIKKLGAPENGKRAE